MNATLSNTKSSSSEDNSDREGNFIASTSIAEVVGGNYGEPSDVDDKEDIEFKAREGSEDESKGKKDLQTADNELMRIVLIMLRWLR
nr:hypothetical protein CFP56_49887 [Quercus suber]